MVCDVPFMDYHCKKYAATEPVKIKYLDKVLDVKENYLNDLVKQKQLANKIAKSSPIVLYENLMTILVGTDFENFKCFKNNVKTYKNNIADYIRSKTQNFTSSSYFTPCKKGDHEKFINIYYKPYLEAKDETEKAEAMKTVEKTYEQMMKETPSLDLRDFPKFTYQPRSIVESLRQAIPALGLLVFASVFFFSLSFVVFLKYDVR